VIEGTGIDHQHAEHERKKGNQRTSLAEFFRHNDGDNNNDGDRAVIEQIDHVLGDSGKFNIAVEQCDD